MIRGLRSFGPFAFGLFAIISFSSLSFAGGVSESTQVGRLEFIQSVSIDGGFQRKPITKDALPKSPWRWNLNYSDSKTTDNSQSTTSIVDETQEISGAFNWMGDGPWFTDVGMVWASTPAENLTSSGINFKIGYEIDFKPAPLTPITDVADADDEDDDDRYEPWLRLSLNGARRNYIEFFNGSTTSAVKKRTVVKPVTGSNTIDQTSIGPSLRWAPYEAWTFGLDFTSYFYSNDIADFVQLLDSPRALQDNFNSLGDSISSFSTSSYFFTVSYDATEFTSLDFSEVYSVIAADLSSSFATRLTCGHLFFQQIKISLGAEYSSSTTSYDTSGILTVSGRFK